MSKTKIEWCDETINPLVGCSRISEGCRNCFAEKLAWRLKCMGHLKYQDVVNRDGWTGKVGRDLDVFHKLPWKPKKVFVVSMGDLFGESVGIYDMDAVYRGMHGYPWHTYMLLTKRPERMAIAVDGWFQGARCVNPNVWLGVTAENQKRADERIPILLQIPAAVRFVSVEPMLGPIELDKTCTSHTCWRANLDWVIAGPETGPGARECKPEWIEDLYHQCQEAGIPFFDKSKNNWLAREFPK